MDLTVRFEQSCLPKLHIFKDSIFSLDTNQHHKTPCGVRLSKSQVLGPWMGVQRHSADSPSSQIKHGPSGRVRTSCRGKPWKQPVQEGAWTSVGNPREEGGSWPIAQCVSADIDIESRLYNLCPTSVVSY